VALCGTIADEVVEHRATRAAAPEPSNRPPRNHL